MQSQKAMMLVLGILCSDLAQAAVNLLWRHQTGEQYQHPFSQPLPAGDFLPQVKQPWQLAAIGDFNGNGEQDLFWYRPDTGQTAFEWFAANDHQSFSDFTSISDSQWQVAASADFDGDGQADLLWRHSASGLYYLWLMAGANISQQAALFSVTDLDWRLAVAADMDGDGRADLLFRHQKSGDNYQFLMQGSQILSQQFVLRVADLNWQLVASADLNGDKSTDLIWRHQQSGQNYGWYLKGGQLAGEVELPRVADLNWQLRAAFDANVQGEACQLWQHKTQQQLVELCSSNGELRSERQILTAAPGWQWSGLRYSRPGYRGEPHPVPGRIEAEQYDRDGPGLSFHDTDDINQGNADLRADGVDIEASSDSGGGFNIGYIGNGEWLKYRVQVAKTGHYKLRLRVAGDDGTGQLHLQQGEQNLTGAVSVAPTGGWQIWQTIESPVFELSEGEQSLKLTFDIGLFNLNYFELVEATDSPAAPVGLKVSDLDSQSLQLDWTLDSAVHQYQVLVNGQLVAMVEQGPFRLQALMPDTSYRLSLVAVDAEGRQSLASDSLQVRTLAEGNGSQVPVFKIGSGRIYHVALDGKDTAVGDDSHPFRSINKFMSVAQAGDTAYIHAGTYIENTENNAHVPLSYFFGVKASLGAQSSGTAGNPITLMARPGDEGKVIIDSQWLRVGLQTNSRDHWQLYGLRFENSMNFGVASPSQAHVELASDADLAVGWRIENCLIKGLLTNDEGNAAAIGMWASQQWIVRNNRMRDLRGNPLTGRGSGGILAYGTIESLVEHNDIEGSGGIYLKDHFLKTLQPRTTHSEFEVRYNRLNVTSTGFVSSIKGSPNVESGSNYIHHNILYGFTEGEYANLGLSDSPYQAGSTYRFEHNLVDAGSTPTALLSILDHQDVRVSGNIFIGGGVIYELRGGSTTRTALAYADYNLFTQQDNFTMLLDRYGDLPVKAYRDLLSWQQANSSDARSLAIDYPDPHSLLVDKNSLLNDVTARDYRYLPSSPAIGLMPDGSNAGPYQLGNETIGLLPSYSAGE